VGAGIAIDNHGLITNDGDLLYALVQKIGHPRVGVNLDTMNFRWYGNDIPTCDRFYTALAPHVLHTHMKDGFDSREHYRGAALGQGEIHLDHALQALKAAGYSGVYCAEYEGPEAAEGVGYRKCCEWLQQNVPETAGA
jgi:sugar phosphate isomerase/epimerase